MPVLRLPRGAREHGQVTVFFALLIPVLFAIAAIVLDVGNWYVHKRHLQTQVDAAALAAGPAFVGCFHDATAANLAIASRALAFAGDTLRPGKYSPTAAEGTTNLQVQEPGDVRIALNSSTYWTDANGLVPGTNGYGLDNTLDSGDADLLGDPCNERYLDVKATDDDAPLLWGLIPATPSPKSKAKVEVHDIESFIGMLPWAVPEIDPARVAALFVNEDNGSIIRTQLLNKADDPSLPWSEWQTAAGYTSLTLGTPNDNTGVIILVSKNDSDPLDNVPNTIAGYCGQSPGLVSCYGRPVAQNNGVSFIHAYNGGDNGTLADPIVRGVELTNVDCSTPGSAPYFTLDGDCTAHISATIDFGVAGNPAAFPNCVEVTASPGGNMTYTGDTPAGTTFEATMSLPAFTGRTQTILDLNWKSRNPTRANCSQQLTGSFDKVAAPYVANGGSGPIQYLDLAAYYGNSGLPVGDANSVEKNDPGNPTYDYVVTVGLPQPLQVLPYTAPSLLLRMASPSGSQNRAFDCDKNVNFADEIINGCETRYIENYRDDDDDPTTPKQWNNFLCTGWDTGSLPPPTPDGPSPYPSDCVMTETGDKTGQLRQGLAARFENPTCTPNRWPTNAAEAADFFGPDGSGYADDPRYVVLIITDDTAFTGAGNDPLPIKYFAGFYATGWDIGGATSGCPDPDGPSGPLRGNDPHPVYGSSYPPSRDNGDVWGHFVDLVVFSGGADDSDELCTFGGDPAACVAVLVE